MKLKISNKEILRIMLIAVATFIILGAVTALYKNMFFQRMTDVSELDYVFLILESILTGLFLGIESAACATKKAGIGGILGFLGFACPICNKILLFIFGSGILLSYFDPIRPLVGTLGILLMSIAVYSKLELKFN